MRVAEHRQDLFNLDEGSHMMRHMMKFHTEVDLENPENRKAEKFFKMEMVRQFRTAMDRQISEALAIARSGGMESTSVMNNFDEYNRCILPELQTSNEIKMKERAKRAREVETQENPKLCKRARKTPTPGTNRHQAEQKGGPVQREEEDKVKRGQDTHKIKTKTSTQEPFQNPQMEPPMVLLEDCKKDGGKATTTAQTDESLVKNDGQQQQQQQSHITTQR